MCVYIYIYVYLSLSLYIYIYIYTYTYVCIALQPSKLAYRILLVPLHPSKLADCIPLATLITCVETCLLHPAAHLLPVPILVKVLISLVISQVFRWTLHLGWLAVSVFRVKREATFFTRRITPRSMPSLS